jgi:hypothetical protein
MEARGRHGEESGQAVHRLSCPETVTDLDCEAALAVVEPYFLAVRETFADHERSEWGGAVPMRRVRLECSVLMHDTERHFAACRDDGRLIVVAPHLAELPEETVVAILAHEFGHAMDYAHPGAYWLDGSGLSRVDVAPEPDDKRVRQTLVARARRWRDRDDDTIERHADAIAEHVTGRTIGYAGPCLLQSFDRGIRRPRGLR